MNTLLSHPFSTKLKVASALLLTLALGACGTPTNPSSSAPSNNSSSTPTSSSSSSAPVVVHGDHCADGFDAHPTDGSLPDEAALYTENGQTDVTVRPEIINWMEQNQWQEAHFLWHQNRRCVGSSSPGGSGAVNPCSFQNMRPAQNECQGPTDGYEFLVMHRHMIHALKEQWPSLIDHFTGWETFPSRENYPSVVQQYYREWNAQVQADADLADNIDRMTKAEVLAKWPTEGHFGQWIQCGSIQGGIGFNGLHGALHFNGYPSRNQAHSIANQHRNLDGYLFWKLHGWIDGVWDKYRKAVDLPVNDTKLQDELVKQCREHHFWAKQLDPNIHL